jgi:hypothetical protein
MKAFGGRRSGDGFEFEQVGDGLGRRRKFEIGSVDNLWSKGCATRDANGLSSVMSFLASGAAGCAGLSSA